MQSRLATTTTPKSRINELQASKTRSNLPQSERALLSSRNLISSQLMNVYYQQKEIAINMFDEWSHEQKVNFLLSVLPRTSYRQLVHVVNWFQDNIPIWSLDFTTVLPRYLSLYILSFLDTKTLAIASSVCWRWKFIAEQDVLWRDRCLILGWQLPFYPAENEYGAWKKYFSKNYSEMKRLGLAIPDLRDRYPVFFNKFDSNHSSAVHTRLVHSQNISIPKLKLSQTVYNVNSNGGGGKTSKEDELIVSGMFESTSLVLQDRSKLLQEVDIKSTPGSLREALSVENTLERRLSGLTQSWTPQAKYSFGLRKIIEFYSEENIYLKEKARPSVLMPFPSSYPAWLGQMIPPSPNPRVVLISNKVQSPELLAISTSWSNVEALVFDFHGSSPASLIQEIKNQLGHRMARSFAIVPSSEGSCMECGFPLTASCYVMPSRLENVNDDGRRFFCDLSALLLPRASGGDGHVDLFAPLMMFREGAQLLLQLNHFTGIIFHCPQTARYEYEHLFNSCDWIVTNSPVGLLEKPNLGSLSFAESPLRAQTLKKLTEISPPKLYFEENRLAFWIKCHKIASRSIKKIRRILSRAFEFRTESCLLDRLVGQVAFEEFKGEEFTQFVSIWPQIVPAIKSVLEERGNGDNDMIDESFEDDQIEWKVIEMQNSAVSVATKLLNYAGFSITQNMTAITNETGVQAHEHKSLDSKQVQTFSLYLGSNEQQQSEMKQHEEPNPDSADKEDTENAVLKKSDEIVKNADEDLILDDHGDAVVFEGAVGEGDTHSSSGIASNEKSVEEYPLEVSSGIRPTEDSSTEVSSLPVNLDISWTLSRSRNKKIPLRNREQKKSQMVYSVLFTEADRRLVAVRDLYNTESVYNKTLTGIHTAFVESLNQAVFQDRPILSSSNVKMMFSDLMQLLEVSNDLMEALESRLENWVDVQGQVSDVLLTFVCDRWNVFLSYMNNYPVALETMDRCYDEQRLFRSFLNRTERTLPVRMLSMAELFALPFDQLASYRSHFRRISAHTPPDHADMEELREARKMMSQYCSVVSERAASHDKKSKFNFLEKSLNSSFQLTSARDGTVTGSALPLVDSLDFEEIASPDLALLRHCPFNIDLGSASERNFVCRQNVTLMRPATGKKIPFDMQLFEVVDEIGFFLFSDCLVVSKRRSIHRAYVREADVAFFYANAVPTRDIKQIDLPDTKYINNVVEYRAGKFKWLVVFPDYRSKNRFMAVIAPLIRSHLPSK